MRFVTLFPESENIHLIKDVGMIAYALHKKYGFQSYLACYNNGEYPYLKKEVKGLKVNFIKKYTGNATLDSIVYLMKNSNKIDVLHIFHLSKRSYLWILIYKFLNSSGKVFLKLDANREIKTYLIYKKGAKHNFIKYIFRKCKLVSVETKELCDYFNENNFKEVKFVPNGFYESNFNIERNVNIKKKDVIITVGRIGSKEKANDILLQAFALIHDKIPNWKLNLVGPIEDKFKDYIYKYFNKYPSLKDKVSFKGPMYDREILKNEYESAKIFCLTSLYESFGFVLVEAIKNGCYVISSDVPAAYDITNNEKYGRIFPVNDIEKLCELLLEKCKSQELKYISNEIQNFAYENYNWMVICDKIKSFLEI
ncbi:glycosyltransferase family 4 protein [Clostridium felsineum]|uniref:glycosyltransferase family 4 protein n=1 Tax=Clostridium felsineum TaxID=36839 RepID=UPI00098C06F3|nr:glycosyltransferase family 4 protein [Clostridium felsineum]URZ14845.1 D-inositol-3-phosphate glycosyltransferase [Clostridium felsineum DSM 794]